MSLINNANAGSQIDLMCIVYRVLSRTSGSMSEDQLLALCRPDTLWQNLDQKDRIPKELSFWSSADHQLWEKDGSNNYMLVSPINGKDLRPRDIARDVRKVLFETQMESVFGQDKWEGLDQLIAMLACVLAIPEFSVLQSSELNKDTLRDALAKFLPAKSRLNDAELSIALQYAHFLGFLEPGEGHGYVVDPTIAIADTLGILLKSSEALRIDEFVTGLAKILPVLDGGQFRLQVEAGMQERDFSPLPEKKLSRSLSHALYRLRISGLVKIDELSDDPNAMTFVLPSGEKKFSRIQLKEEQG